MAVVSFQPCAMQAKSPALAVLAFADAMHAASVQQQLQQAHACWSNGNASKGGENGVAAPAAAAAHRFADTDTAMAEAAQPGSTDSHAQRANGHQHPDPAQPGRIETSLAAQRAEQTQDSQQDNSDAIVVVEPAEQQRGATTAQPPVAAAATAANAFDSKTDAASASMYFHYYGMLQHQQNMLQVRALFCARAHQICSALQLCHAWCVSGTCRICSFAER